MQRIMRRCESFSLASFRRRVPHPCRVAAAVAIAAACGLVAGPSVAELPRDRLTQLADEAGRANAQFRPADDAALDAAATSLRQALEPLDRLLARSKSGEGWRTYLDWPALSAQAATGKAADPRVLRQLEELLNATETGLEMPEFVRVRRAVARYAEVADAARGDGAARTNQRLESLGAALRSAAESGRADGLVPVQPILERLTDSGQAAPLVAAVRGMASRPNLLLEIRESLMAQAVNRPVDRVMPVQEMMLGTRIRGTGHTRGDVRLDFVPCENRAAFDLVFSATNISDTRGSQGPVTVCTHGVTKLDARRRLFLDEHTATAGPVQVAADADTSTTGIGVNAAIGQRLIRKVASRKVAETKPQAEAIAEGRARERLRREFQEQTDPAVSQFREQFQSKVRGPLQAEGLYPELLHMSTTDDTLIVTARKSAGVQLAAASLPPSTDPGNVLSARVHETAINNALETRLAGRIFTQDDVVRIARERNAKMPESLGSDPDQQPWAVTFAKHRPVSVSVDDGRVKVMVRGDKFVSGDRSFGGMDIWATYAIGSSSGGLHLIREGDVQIYPPGFKPGGTEKLSMAETSLRRILQKRFDKLFKQVIDLPDLPLQGELAAAGPLPMHQLEARRDGWVVAGWRKRDAVMHLSGACEGTVVPGGDSVPAEILSDVVAPVLFPLAWVR